MQNNSKALIRAAKIEDAPEIANVHVNSWRETYYGLMPDSIIENLPLSFKRRMNWWSECISAPKNNRNVWVAEIQKHGIIGFSSIEAARDKIFKGIGELTCIYLLKAYHQEGIGYLL